MIALKVLLTPALIAVATLMGRRFGESLSGWLVGFPFTSAPVSLFLALEQGHAFAAHAAVGSVAGVLPQTAFALAYAGARSRGWPAALGAGTAAFAAVGVGTTYLDAPAFAFAALDAFVLLAALRIMPRPRARERVAAVTPRWDLPARAAVATTLVVALTAVAPLLGAFASGVVSGFPLYASVLAIFAHRVAGPGPAAEVMRGLLAGLFGYAAFFVVVALTLVPLGAVIAYGLAAVTVLIVQSISLAFLRRGA